MKVQGWSTGKPDKAATVRCGCGATLFKLKAGEYLTLSKVGQKISVVCEACCKKTIYRVKTNERSN